jgi:hypothetical protein
MQAQPFPAKPLAHVKELSESHHSQELREVEALVQQGKVPAQAYEKLCALNSQERQHQHQRRPSQVDLL